MRLLHLELIAYNSEILFLLPLEESKRLPSQGMNMIQLIFPNVHSSKLEDGIVVPIEPDGKGGHWGRLPAFYQAHIVTDKANLPQLVKASYNIVTKWSSPELPEDLKHAIKSDHCQNTWDTLTTKSQWQFLRWINLSAQAETRSRRIAQTIDHLIKKDKRRPCCFDQTRCTDPHLAISGKLKINRSLLR